VRGKVTSFRLDDPNINPKEKVSATEEAQAYFKLAAEYAKKL
jgi:aminoglycoside phosphotransferase family enzyme